jgi:hypothetical protein
MRMYAEQASKSLMQKATRSRFGEGCNFWESERNMHPGVLPG